MAFERVIKTFAGSRSRHCTAQSSGCTVPRSALDCSYTRCQSFTHVPVRQAQDGLEYAQAKMILIWGRRDGTYLDSVAMPAIHVGTSPDKRLWQTSRYLDGACEGERDPGGPAIFNCSPHVELPPSLSLRLSLFPPSLSLCVTLSVSLTHTLAFETSLHCTNASPPMESHT